MNKTVREINPDALFHLVVRRWHLILVVPLLTLLAAGVAWYKLPHRYESTAQLLIQDQQTVNPFLEDLLEEWSAKQRMPLVEGIFRSHDTSERTLRKLGRLDDTASPEEVNKAVANFQRMFKVVGLGGELIGIKMQGETPSEAYEANTALISTFTEQMLRPQRETFQASAEFFEDQLEQLRAETTSIEPSITQRPETGPASLDGKLSIRRALAEAEIRLASVEQQVAVSTAKLQQGSSRSSRGVRQLAKDLVEARSELSELQHVYGEDHPELAVAQDRVRWLREALRRERRNREDISTQPISAARTVSGPQPGPDKGGAHRNLLLELREARSEVELLRQRLLTEKLSTFETANQIWTVEAPLRPTRSLKPPLWMVFAGALVAGLILAVLAVVFFAALDDAVRGEKELAEALDAPSIGRMPRGEA